MPAKSKRQPKPIDPTLAALRARQEEDRKRREAEFAARGQEWSQKAPEFVEAARTAKKGRRKPPTVEQVRERVRKEEERQRRREQESHEAWQRQRDEFKAKMDDFARQAAERQAKYEQEAAERQARREREDAAEAIRDRERAEQRKRDRDYLKYLEMIGAPRAQIRELLRQLQAARDDNYGVGPNKVYHQFTPPHDWHEPADDEFIYGRPAGPQPQHYAVLGVKPDASWDEVKAAHRRAVMKHHPDRGGDVVQFRKAQEAFEAIEKTHQRRRTV